MILCSHCATKNEDDSQFCDQCGGRLDSSQRVSPPPAPEPGPADAAPDEPCPACGGKVRDLGGDKGICLSCGLQLAAVEDEPAPAPVQRQPELAKAVEAAIVSRIQSGMPLELAVRESLALYGIGIDGETQAQSPHAER